MAESSTAQLRPRPLATIQLAKEPARKKLAARLISKFKLEKQIANAIARMVVDPTAVRNQVEYPTIKRFPGGEAKFIVADVFSGAVCVSPINPRETENRAYPISAAAGETLPPPITVQAASNGQPVLYLTAESREHVETTLWESANFLKREGAHLKESIELDGVLDPVTVFMADLRHRDREGSLVIPIPVDGSTRVTFCHELAGFDPVEVVYRWPIASQRDWRGKLGQIVAYQGKPVGTLTEEERSAHRALTLQARILVEVNSLRDGEPATVVTAMRAIVGGIHVGHPAEWPKGSEWDEIAEAVLDQLVNDTKATKKEREYIAGLIEPAYLESKGFQKHHDARAAFIAKVIFDPKNSSSVSAGYRGLVVNRQRLGKDDKPSIAAELIMRSFRKKLKPAELSAVRSALQRTINLTEWRDLPWNVTAKSPDQLLAAALRELRAENNHLGAAQLELGILATYWLTSKRAIRRDTAQSIDQRSGGTILRALMESEYGLRVLHHAIIHGRRHQDVLRPIPAIDPAGNPMEQEDGGTIEMNDKWLRETFPESDVQKGIPSHGGDARPSPQSQLDQYFKAVARKGNEIHDLADQMSKLQDNGVLLAKTKGLPSATANDLSAKLQTVANRLSFWANIYDELAQTLPEEVEELDRLPPDGGVMEQDKSPVS